MITAVLTLVCITELIRWQTLRRAALQNEVRWQARLLAETPNPVLRIAADFKVLSCNPAAAPFVQSGEAAGDQTIPLAWRPVVSKTLLIGQPAELEWEDRGRIYACVFSPVTDENYVNTFIVDITARHAAEAELRRQNDYLAALHETTLGLMNHLDLAKLLEAIVGRATQLVNAIVRLAVPGRSCAGCRGSQGGDGVAQIMGRHPVAARRRLGRTGVADRRAAGR